MASLVVGLRYIETHPGTSIRTMTSDLQWYGRSTERVVQSLHRRNLITKNGNGTYTAVPEVSKMTEEDWLKLSRRGKAMPIAGVQPSREHFRKAKHKPTAPLKGTESKPRRTIVVNDGKASTLDGNFAVIDGEVYVLRKH